MLVELVSDFPVTLVIWRVRIVSSSPGRYVLLYLQEDYLNYTLFVQALRRKDYKTLQNTALWVYFARLLNFNMNVSLEISSHFYLSQDI